MNLESPWRLDVMHREYYPLEGSFEQWIRMHGKNVPKPKFVVLYLHGNIGHTFNGLQ